MALPVVPNTTCDIYRSGNSPPSAPDVAGVSGQLKAMYNVGLELGDADAIATKFTHMLLVDCPTDIRDAYDANTIGATADTVYIPDKNGVGYKVIYMEIIRPGTPTAHKRVFLTRQRPSWPNSNL